MDISITILTLIRDSNLAIVSFQEELMTLKENYSVANEEETQLLDQMVEDIHFITGTIVINRTHLEQILLDIQKNSLYYHQHQKEIDILLEQITQFNKEHILNLL